MPLYMLDTDTSSCIMKCSHPAVLQRLSQVAVSEACISVVTKAELMYGVETSPRHDQDQARLQNFLLHVQSLDFPDAAASHYARIRAALKRVGRLIGANDMLLAAYARSLGLTLVTNNTREFSRVEGLAIENWTEPADNEPGA